MISLPVTVLPVNAILLTWRQDANGCSRMEGKFGFLLQISKWNCPKYFGTWTCYIWLQYCWTGELGSRDEKSAILVGTGFPTHVLERAQPYMGMPGRTNVVVYLASNFVAYFNTWEVANA